MHKIRKTKLFPMILAFLVLVSCGAAFSQVTRWRHNHLVRDNVGAVFSDQDLSVIAPGSTNTYKFQVQASTGNIYASGSFFVGGATVYTTLYAGSVYATNSVATNTYSDTLWATSSYITHLISNDINTVGLWATTVTATTTYSGDSYADYLVVGGTTSNVELTGAGAINASSTIYSATAIGVPETTGAINLNFGTGTKQIMADADSMNLMMDTTDQLELQSALAPVFVVDGGGNVFASGGMNMATASIAWDVTMTGGSLALLSGGISAATTSFTNASITNQIDAASATFTNNVMLTDLVASGGIYADSATFTNQVSASAFYGDGSHLTGLPANTLDSVLTSGNVTSQDAYVHSIIASGTLYASDTSFSSGTVNGDFYITGKLTVDGSIDPIDGTFSGVLSSAASDIGDVAYATDSNYPLEVVATNTASGIKIYNTSAGTTGVAITTSHLKSPAVANDIVGVWNINGRDSGGADTTYSQIYSKVNDATNATETASLYFNTVLSGTATSALYVDGLNKKVVTPLQTAFNFNGGAPFTVANSTVVTNLNADMLDGTSAAGFATLAGNNTFTGMNTISAVGALATPAKLTFTETSTGYDAGIRKYSSNSKFEIFTETALASGIGDGSILGAGLVGSTSTVYTGLTAGDAWSMSAFLNASSAFYVIFPATGTGAGGHNGIYGVPSTGIIYAQYVNAAGVAKQKPCDFGAGGIPSGSRYFLAVTHDASDGVSCTIDGTTVTGGAEAVGSSIYGAYGVFAYSNPGGVMLNELRLYKGTTVLSAADIVNLWVSGAGTEDTDVGVTGTNTLIDRWTFNTNPTTYSIDDVGTIQIAPDSGQWYVWTGTSVTVETSAINIENSATTGLKADVDISEGMANTFLKGYAISMETGSVETQRLIIESDGDIGVMASGSPTGLVDIHADSTTKIPLVVQASYGHATETFKIMDSTQAPMIYTEADGTLVFASNATVWDDIRIPGSAAIPSSVTAPALRDFNGSIVQTYQFQPTAASDTLYFQVQIPHGYKLGTDLYPHIHWSPDTDGNGTTDDVLWSLNCQVATDSVRFASSTQMWASATVGTDDQWKQKVSYFACDNSYTGDWGAAGQVGCRTNGQAYFEGSELTDISAMFVCRLQRAIGADSFGGYAALGEIDFHFEKDMDGSRNQTTK